MVKKNFSRVNDVTDRAILPNKLVVLPKRRSDEVVNLERVDLADRENWLRALDICGAKADQPLDVLLQEIETYQGQIDQALQTAQAQSTIYAYAIGTRLDLIEEQGLFKEKGYDNLTAFIKNGEIRRPSGVSITARQVWTYRRVTRGLKEFLQIAESIRDGSPLSPALDEHIAYLKVEIDKDVVEAFLSTYAESIAGVLELGVSKLEQVCRLPAQVALRGLISGKIPLEQEVIEVRDVSFSQLRKAISSHEKGKKLPDEKTTNTKVDHCLDNIEKTLGTLSSMQLNEIHKERLKSFKDFLEQFL